MAIPCIIKYPSKTEIEGLIVGDRGTEFDVKVNDEVQTVSKFYVFPHFLPPPKCQKDREITPSKNSAKSRRKRGTGSGYIYWRTIKKNGKEYQQTFYHYEKRDKYNRRVKSCEYIPLKMRSQIEQMNNDKVPVTEILKVLRRRSKRKK
ncbi:MAG: hypothetical protein QNJ55_35505 [Xenococcus sp. MO_188.B8]|nr:hypothetical protein [Xenococcus sp. MO_188.B8]